VVGEGEVTPDDKEVLDYLTNEYLLKPAGITNTKTTFGVKKNVLKIQVDPTNNSLLPLHLDEGSVPNSVHLQTSKTLKHTYFYNGSNEEVYIKLYYKNDPESGNPVGITNYEVGDIDYRNGFTPNKMKLKMAWIDGFGLM
jgi:hypothetical protein